MATACPHGMPTPGSCVDCMDEGNIAPAPRPEPARALRFITARFPGECRGGCGLAIHEGQTIAVMSDESYRHQWCA